MQRVLIQGLAIFHALRKSDSDFDDLWNLLNTENILGYITAEDLLWLEHTLNDELDAQQASLIISSIHNTLTPLPDTKRQKLDAAVVSDERNSTSQIPEELPRLTVSQFLERHALDLLLQVQPNVDALTIQEIIKRLSCDQVEALYRKKEQILTWVVFGVAMLVTMRQLQFGKAELAVTGEIPGVEPFNQNKTWFVSNRETSIRFSAMTFGSEGAVPNAEWDGLEVPTVLEISAEEGGDIIIRVLLEREIVDQSTITDVQKISQAISDEPILLKEFRIDGDENNGELIAIEIAESNVEPEGLTDQDFIVVEPIEENTGDVLEGDAETSVKFLIPPDHDFVIKPVAADLSQSHQDFLEDYPQGANTNTGLDELIWNANPQANLQILDVSEPENSLQNDQLVNHTAQILYADDSSSPIATVYHLSREGTYIDAIVQADSSQNDSNFINLDSLSSDQKGLITLASASDSSLGISSLLPTGHSRTQESQTLETINLTETNDVLLGI